MEFRPEEVLEFYQNETTKSEALKAYCKAKGIQYQDKFRKRFSRYLASIGYFEDETDTDTQTNQYANDIEDEKQVFMPSAWNPVEEKFYTIDEYCDRYNLPKEQVRSSKLVAHLSSHMIYNIAFEPTIHERTGIDAQAIEEIVKKHIERIPVSSTVVSDRDYFDRLVITDIHIGMSVNGGRNVEPLYDGTWNKEELFKRGLEAINFVRNNRKGNVLYIDDLGDLADGLFGQTVRKHHELPQNMTDKESFETAIEFKVFLVENLLDEYEEIVCNNIVEDNHSGVFSYFINYAVKQILENKYRNVKYNLIQRFIEHYSVGTHTFIISHGKDSESLKFGFKPFIDKAQAEKIDQYCKEHRLYNGKYIEFSKGDSHQAVFDDTSSNDFVYYSYPAFSPPSNYVKTNFKKSKSGFVFFNIDRNSQLKNKMTYYFE